MNDRALPESEGYSKQGEPADTVDDVHGTSHDTNSRPGDSNTFEALTRLGRYKIECSLGKGGFGQVFRAWDEELQRQVAIKIPLRSRLKTADDLEAYMAEARLVASLDHPSIVQVYDIGRTDDGMCFVVSKYIPGRDLSKALARGELNQRESVNVVAKIADALQFAHKAGLVHRDVKPGNILLDESDEPFLTDFGLALREEDFDGDSRWAGTPDYMSPEQARGEGNRVDGRSDVFSLGVVLYEALTGKRPFTGKTPQSLLSHITSVDAKPPRQRDDSIPSELERVCLKALEKRVSDRYTTAKDFAMALRAAIVDPIAGEVAAPQQSLVGSGESVGSEKKSRWMLHVQLGRLVLTLGVLSLILVVFRVIPWPDTGTEAVHNPTHGGSLVDDGETMVDDPFESESPTKLVDQNGRVDHGIEGAPRGSDANMNAVRDPSPNNEAFVTEIIDRAVAPLDNPTEQKGKVAGAVDRITFEILQSMEERPTLVVWLFDQSGSLHRTRRQIRDRLDRIYEELGMDESSGSRVLRRSNDNDFPLLTSVVGFGGRVTLYTEDPTDNLEEIKAIVDNIEVDSSGEERVFTAITSTADHYKSLRRSRGSDGPQRNVLFIVITDERGDDANLLESSIDACRKWGIPVYVIGVPAPFGREHTLVKYVDPDPKYDQSPSWTQVVQGPETFLPERVQVGFIGNFEQEPVIDSGFGPYALTRLCYETGGIYFTVHPNRNVDRKVDRDEIEAFASYLQYFFDPVAMSRYRPDYLSQQDYVAMVKASPLRQALVMAAQLKPATGLSRPQTRFVRHEEAQFVGDLTRAQQDAAKLEPTLVRMAQTLEAGAKSRDTEENLRWKAGFDLALGRVLAQKVRTETYSAMLAQAKRGMPFKEKMNNTWILQPSDEISVGSKWKSEAETATQLLKGVADRDKGTPWAFLAAQELKVPIGWIWKEEFTDPNLNRPAGEIGEDTDSNVLRGGVPSRQVPSL